MSPINVFNKALVTYQMPSVITCLLCCWNRIIRFCWQLLQNIVCCILLFLFGGVGCISFPLSLQTEHACGFADSPQVTPPLPGVWGPQVGTCWANSFEISLIWQLQYVWWRCLAEIPLLVFQSVDSGRIIVCCKTDHSFLFAKSSYQLNHSLLFTSRNTLQHRKIFAGVCEGRLQN